MEITNIMIEMTRRCNMRCEHCLRGDAEDLDVDPRVIQSVIDEITNNIVECSVLGLTGGEPFLNPKMIIFILKELMSAAAFISLPQFDIVTNGSVWDPELMLVLLNYHALSVISKGESYCTLCVSTDQFHDGPDELVFEMFKGMKFFSDSKSCTISEESIINEGKAYEHGIGTRSIEVQKEDTVYITCTGDVIIGCDYSYRNMEDIVLGNVLERSLSEIISEYRINLSIEDQKNSCKTALYSIK